MADHFYSIAAVGQAFERKIANIVVNTSTQTSAVELRVTDGGISKAQVYAFLEFLADELESSGDSIFVAGTLL